MMTKVQRHNNGQLAYKQKYLAVLGPKNTYSDIAGTKYLQKMGRKDSVNAEKIYFNSIAAVFEAVEKGGASAGIVPLENVIYGSVRETFDQLFFRNVHISHKLKLKMRHALVTLPTTKKKDINTIASHEQAIGQCSRYLEKYYPSAQKEYSTSTMAALEKMLSTHDGELAVIIPLESAMVLPVKILARNIENSEKNFTTFVVIKKGAYEKTPKSTQSNVETAVAFYFHQDSPGCLYLVLREFANAGINLSHIESRPSLNTPGTFIFFLNFEGAPSDHLVAKILEDIKKYVAGMKILGVYSKI